MKSLRLNANEELSIWRLSEARLIHRVNSSQRLPLTSPGNVNYLQRWIGQLRWQRLRPFEKLADMLVNHLDGILNYYRTKVPLGTVEAINGNIKSLLRRGLGTAICDTCCSRHNG